MVSGQEMQQIINVQMVKRGVKSQAELCRAVGISGPGLTHYFDGTARIPAAILSRICSYLGMTQEERGAFLM